MIGLQNRDTSFFEIKSKDLGDAGDKNSLASLIPTPKGFQVLSPDVISFSITEEMSRIISGTISFHDPLHIYSRIMRIGVQLDISWGYKKPDSSVQAFFAKQFNKDEVEGDTIREGIKAYVQSPSGTMNENGSVIFNCNFYGTYYLAAEKRKVYKTGTKQSVIKAIFDDMGIKAENQVIKFDRENEKITPDTYVMQYETDFKFILRLAYEWRAIYRIGYNNKGELVAVFCNPKYIDKLKFNLKSTGAVTGSSVLIDYKQGISNVRSASWQNHMGMNGTGDNVRIQLINGKPTFVRFVQKGETVTAWRLNADKIDEELRKKPDFASKSELMKQWMNAKDFESVKKYFIPVKESTAPQGLGYSAKVKMVGNPLCTAPMRVEFGNGFPDFFKHQEVNYYCRKVTHTITTGGYEMDLDIADYYTITGGSLI